MPFPESVIVCVMARCDFHCSSAERGIYEFCIGNYRECHVGKKGVSDAFKVEVLVKVGISNLGVGIGDLKNKE